PASLALSLSILNLVFTLAAYLRWSALSRRKRFVMEYGIARKTLRNRRQRNEVPGIALVLLGLMLVIAVSAFALSSNHFPINNGVAEVNVSKLNDNNSASSNFSGKESDSTGDEDRFVVLGTVIDNYLGNESIQGSSSSHTNHSGFPKEFDNEKSDQSSIGRAHEEIPEATRQVSAFSDGIPESNSKDVDYGGSETIDLSQTAGIHQPDRKMNEIVSLTNINTLKPAQEFKGDRIQPPQQIAAREAGKISLAESQDRVKDFRYDLDNTTSTESNKISAAEGSSSSKKANAQDVVSNTPVVSQRGSILAEKQKESMGTNLDSGAKQSSQEIGSKELNAQSISSMATASNEAYASGRESSSKKTEGLQENKLPDEKPTEMENEINSWMGARGTSVSNEDEKSFQSKNIHYVKEGSTGKAVLGRQARSNTQSWEASLKHQ
ncbi:MAG: hypothetical protein LUQ38_06530, partial [Methanotrichaceae archaeon]|nr:hypothetical protein [Methanotrichaceae archaeon]